MANSLQDQLIKAGLATEEQLRAKKAKAPRPPRRAGGKKKVPKGKRGAKPAVRSEPAQAEQSPPPKSTPATPTGTSVLGAGKAQRLVREAERARMLQLLRRERLDKADADVPYNFVRGKKVKRIYVTQEQQTALGQGLLAIVEVDNRHHLVTREVSERLREMVPDLFIHAPEKESPPSPDDPYAEFQVPDDLTW